MNGKGVAAVTGASRGIGRSTAFQLAERGFHVFALARSEPDLRDVVNVSVRRGWNVTPVVMDITDSDSRQMAVDTIMTATNGYGLDVLVNNAGYGQMGPLEELPIDKLQRQLDVNVVGLIALTQPFIAPMRERRRGWVVNISSAAGRIATPFMGAYNTSKFALEGMSDALRRELAPFGVHVVLIEPGPIPTDFGRVAGEESAVQPNSAYAHFLQRYKRTHGNVGFFSRSPETVARVIARAVESNRPRARYTVTLPAKLATIGRLLPDRVADWCLRVALGLKRIN